MVILTYFSSNLTKKFNEGSQVKGASSLEVNCNIFLV
jgi:hypothetical protein